MKNLRTLFAGLFGFLFVYLIACFWKGTFNINNWQESDRALIGFCGAVMFALLACYSRRNYEY
jgi:biotin transporter BioY